MTRYLERHALRDLLASSSDPYAQELARALTGASTELIAVTPVQAATLLPTYVTRLEAAAAGAGPRTRGLAEFVEAVRGPDVAEMFAVTEGDVTGIGLIATLGHVVAVTLIIGSDSS